MSDFLSDIYPVPVEFVDGQQPTAAFLTAWASQIDDAFVLLSRVIGDFDGSGDIYAAYITNLIRSFGAMGWINTRLPRGLRVTVPNGAGAAQNLPRMEETMTQFDGDKIALLAFFPAATEATNGDDLIDVSLNNGEFTTARAKLAGDAKYANLNSPGDWMLDGRRVLTYDAIDGTSKLVYAIDTDDESYRDAYGPETGSNLIPSMYEISSSLTDLCVITQPVGYAANEYRLDFPEVRRIQNPAYAQTSTESNTLKLDDPASEIKWSGEAPLYIIPPWIYTLSVGNGNTIPNGIVALWHDNGTAISRVRSVVDQGLITWELIAGTKSAVKITVPDGITLPEDAEPGEAKDNRYIIAFAGTSVAEALPHERSRMLLHKHDGQGDESLVSTEYLTDRFNPEWFYHSTENKYNWFPQYLERAGYDAAEIGNRANAMLGMLFMAQFQAQPENTNSPQDLTEQSHRIAFGHSSQGPRMYWEPADVVGDAAADNTGKLLLENKAYRSIGHHYFGPVGAASFLTSRSEVGQEVLSHESDRVTASETMFETGSLRLRGGAFIIDDYNEVGTTLYGYFDDDGGDPFLDLGTTAGDTRIDIQAGGLRVKTLDGDQHIHQVSITSGQIITGAMSSGFASVGGEDYSIRAPIVRSTGYGGNLDYVVQIPRPETIGLEYTGGNWRIKNVYVYLYADTSGADIEDVSSGTIRIVRVNGSQNEEIQVDSSPPSIAIVALSNTAVWSIGGGGADGTTSISTTDSFFLCVGINGSGDTRVGITGIRVIYDMEE